MSETMQVIAMIPVEMKALLRDPLNTALLEQEPIEWLGDAAGMARYRAYEPIFPVTAIGPMPLVTTTFYTSTLALTRVYIELVNAANSLTATCTLERVTGGVTAVIIPSGTTIALGVGTRLGPYDLGENDFIQGLSNPANSIHIHPIVDRYNPTGDTP